MIAVWDHVSSSMMESSVISSLPMGSRVDSVEGIRPLSIMFGSGCRELNRSRVEFRVRTRPSLHVYVTISMVVCRIHRRNSSVIFARRVQVVSCPPSHVHVYVTIVMIVC